MRSTCFDSPRLGSSVLASVPKGRVVRSLPSANQCLPVGVSRTWGTWSFHCAGACDTKRSWGSQRKSMWPSPEMILYSIVLPSCGVLSSSRVSAAGVVRPFPPCGGAGGFPPPAPPPPPPPLPPPPSPPPGGGGGVAGGRSPSPPPPANRPPFPRHCVGGGGPA